MVAVFVPGRLVEEVLGQTGEFLVVALTRDFCLAFGFEGFIDGVVGHFWNLNSHWNEALSTAW
jgi:hypothetical protein